MSRRSLLWLLVGLVLGFVFAPSRPEAQAPRTIYVASSAGPVPAVGSTSGTLTVNGQ